MAWDPSQYTRYADERGRPFVDLLGRVFAEAPRRVVDLGCGPGTMTALLCSRWPHALVEGVDSSPEMIAAAMPGDRLTFRVEDVAEWTPPADADVVISNATLHWIPAHRELIARWAAALPVGGWLAFQVPGNFAAPSHALLRSLASSETWAERLSGIPLGVDAVGSPAAYATLLGDAGLVADVWETTYLQLLTGADPVLEWMRGTSLRPVLAALSDADGAAFCAQFGAELRAAYPAAAGRTQFPFRRVFAVAHRS